GVKMNPASAGNSGSYKDNALFPIRIEGNARGSALKFVFGRRRLTARVVPLLSLAEFYAMRLLTQSALPAGRGDECGL
ncbi:MAG: hypothetical protein ACRD22_04885, partial [Terriglobia bacterium]